MLIATAFLAAAGCASVRSSPASLAGNPFQVVEINGRAVPGTHLYRVQFDGDLISGRFGCNQFSGNYRIERERLIARQVVSTLIGCPEPAASHESQAFLVLNQPMDLEWHSGNRLTLSNASGSIGLKRLPG